MNRAAVIYIGSRVLQFYAAELTEDGIEELEFVESNIALGHESFTSGRIQLQTIEQVANRIKDFKRLAGDYGIEDLQVFGTTALREARNREFVLDQLSFETGLEVSVFEDAEEKMYFYNQIVEIIEGQESFAKEPALIAYVGTGNIGVTHYSGEAIHVTQNIPLGTLRLREKVGDSLLESEGFASFLDDYLDNAVHLFKRYIPKEKTHQVLVAGKQTDLLTRAFQLDGGDRVVSLDRKTFEERYSHIKASTPEQIVAAYDLTYREADILLPAMAIFRKMLQMSKAQTLTVIRLRFVDLLMNRLLNDRSHRKEIQDFNRHSIASARRLGRQYNHIVDHAQMVESLALQIFDETKKVHGLGRVDRFRMQLAAILHGIAGFEDTKAYHQIIYDMLRNFNIVGLRERDLLIIAETVHKFLHGSKEDEFVSPSVPPKQKTRITKMAAILLLAESLDQSRTQKFQDCQVVHKKGDLLVKAQTSVPYELEGWYFDRAAKWFNEIFGVNPKLEIKRGYKHVD